MREVWILIYNCESRGVLLSKEKRNSYRRGLIPRKGIILQYEPMLNPPLGTLRFLVEGTRFQHLVLQVTRSQKERLVICIRESQC